MTSPGSRPPSPRLHPRYRLRPGRMAFRSLHLPPPRPRPLPSIPYPAESRRTLAAAHLHSAADGPEPPLLLLLLLLPLPSSDRRHSRHARRPHHPLEKSTPPQERAVSSVPATAKSRRGPRWGPCRSICRTWQATRTAEPGSRYCNLQTFPPGFRSLLPAPWRLAGSSRVLNRASLQQGPCAASSH